MSNKNVPNNLSRYSFLIIIIISVLVLSYVVNNPLSSDSKKINYSRFLKEAEQEGAISEVKYMDTQNKIEGKFKNGDTFTVSVPKESKSLEDNILEMLTDSKADVLMDDKLIRVSPALVLTRE